MWVIVLLLLIGGTIVCVRLFRNGALGEELAEPEEPEPAPVVSQPPRAAPKPRARARTAAAPAPDTTASPEVTAAESTPEPSPEPAIWPGGPCPACGAETVPAAKFCGDCGHKLS